MDGEMSKVRAGVGSFGVGDEARKEGYTIDVMGLMEGKAYI
jgi:hypothetical protein